MANGGGWKDGRMDGRLEIPPCVLQDIGPLGPLPKKRLYGAQIQMPLQWRGWRAYMLLSTIQSHLQIGEWRVELRYCVIATRDEEVVDFHHVPLPLPFCSPNINRYPTFQMERVNRFSRRVQTSLCTWQRW